MGVGTLVLVVVATALLSSVTTLGLAYFVLQRRWERQWRAALDDRLAGLAEVVREKVRQGVLDAVSQLPSPEIVRGTTQSVVRTASTLLEGTLDTLLGGGTSPRK